MDTVAERDLAGLGVYTLQEAALYGRLSSQKLSRWVFGSCRHSPVIDSPLSDKHLLSFYDLVQAMAVNRARENHISLPKIREAIERARTEYGVDLPLAYRHQMGLFDSELLITLPDKRIIQLTGRGHDQIMMNEIVEPFMDYLTFGEEGLVVRYTPFESHGRKVVLDPRIQFGQPLIGDTGCRADTLAHAYSVEKSFDFVAHIYNVSARDVRTAVEYIKSLRRTAA